MKLGAYITNLSAYSAGILRGDWVTMPTDAECFGRELQSIGVGPDGEWFVTDYDCEIDINSELGETPDLEQLNDWGEWLDGLDAAEEKAMRAGCEVLTPGEARDHIERGNYRVWDGCKTMADVAEQYIDETGMLDSVPEPINYYFDYAAYGRDLDIEGTFVYVDGDMVEFY